MLKNRITGKNVLVTGASSGIGLAVAREFARYGANLVLTARRVDRLENIRSQLIDQFGVNVFVTGMDVTHPKQVEMVLSTLPSEFSKTDILVNNAGLALGLSHLVDDDVTNWDTMIDTNVKGFLTVLRIVGKKMVSQGAGHIINIGSVAGVEAYANGAVYCATKHAVHAISQALREEMVEHGIKVSEIMPGAVNTEFSTVRFKGDKERADAVYNGFDPLQAEDIAELVVYNANLPSHVNLAESLILAGRQSRATKIHKQL